MHLGNLPFYIERKMNQLPDCRLWVIYYSEKLTCEQRHRHRHSHKSYNPNKQLTLLVPVFHEIEREVVSELVKIERWADLENINIIC
jgi:hypothetical protein